MNIKLSILIPVFNYKDGLNEIINCLKNTKNSLRKNIEIIISDDSSKRFLDLDLNVEFINSFGNFQYIHNKKSLGAIANWNKLISMARGDYFWLLHHDEYWEKDKKLIQYILKIVDNETPNLIILPIKKLKAFTLGKLIINLTQDHMISKNIQKRFLFNPKLLIQLNILGPPSILIYKKCLLKYNPKLRYLVDIDFYYRIIKNFNSNKVVLSEAYYNLISSQNNNHSITNALKDKIYNIKDIEIKILLKKYELKFNFPERLFILYSYILLKINLLKSIKIGIKKRIYEKY